MKKRKSKKAYIIETEFEHLHAKLFFAPNIERTRIYLTSNILEAYTYCHTWGLFILLDKFILRRRKIKHKVIQVDFEQYRNYFESRLAFCVQETITEVRSLPYSLYETQFLNLLNDEVNGSCTGTCSCGGNMYSYIEGSNSMTACEDCGYHEDFDDEPTERHTEPWNRVEPDNSDDYENDDYE